MVGYRLWGGSFAYESTSAGKSSSLGIGYSWANILSRISKASDVKASKIKRHDKYNWANPQSWEDFILSLLKSKDLFAPEGQVLVLGSSISC